MEPTKERVLAKLPKIRGRIKNVDPVLNKAAGLNFHNRSRFDFGKLAADPNNVASNLRSYARGFSEDAASIMDYFKLEEQISKLDERNLLYEVVKRFSEFDLHPDRVSSIEMGYAFEELIRKFSEISNETAGEHFTPREIIKLMVNVLFLNDAGILTKRGITKTLYDPACGTGGMLSVAEEHLRELNPQARLEVFGQEINPESYAICKSDMAIKGQNASNVKFGNTFTQDGLERERFDYMLSNPPFGVDWKKYAQAVKSEHQSKGYAGRFGAGLPRISDGSLLFLQHMLSKAKPEGSRIAIVFNGSPLFTGGAGSGESEIRRWIIESDWLEAVIALPDQLFYNTGIHTYVWVLTNGKEPKRKGKIQLVNATSDRFYSKMKKSLGSKRHEVDAIDEIVQTYGGFRQGKHCKIFDNEDFGYRQVTVERPLVENGRPVVDGKGNPKPNPQLRDTETIPLKENPDEYLEREVKPHVPNFWVDKSKEKIGYEINFAKHFYEFKPLRSLQEIKKEILALEKETRGMIREAVE